MCSDFAVLKEIEALVDAAGRERSVSTKEAHTLPERYFENECWKSRLRKMFVHRKGSGSDTVVAQKEERKAKESIEKGTRGACETFTRSAGK